MVELEADIRYWTPNGMSVNPWQATAPAYITVAEAERLCEEAHVRGHRAGILEATTNARYKEGS